LFIVLACFALICRPRRLIKHPHEISQKKKHPHEMAAGFNMRALLSLHWTVYILCCSKYVRHHAPVLTLLA